MDTITTDQVTARDVRRLLLSSFRPGHDTIIAKCTYRVSHFNKLHLGQYGMLRENSRRYYASDNLLDSDYWTDVKIMPRIEKLKDPRKAWRAVADSMKKYGINNFAVKEIERALAGESCARGCEKSEFMEYKNNDGHTHFAQNYWNVNKDMPKKASFADCWRKLQLRGINSIADLKKIVDKKVKLRDAGNGEYTWEGVSIDGIKRDRSLGMERARKDTDYYYHAASEYHGCGNGSYYLMINESTAIYMEDD